MTFNTTKSDTHKLVEVNVCVASLYQENLLHSYGKQDYLQYIYILKRQIYVLVLIILIILIIFSLNILI